jgi:hypothetical protein
MGEETGGGERSVRGRTREPPRREDDFQAALALCSAATLQRSKKRPGGSQEAPAYQLDSPPTFLLPHKWGEETKLGNRQLHVRSFTPARSPSVCHPHGLVGTRRPTAQINPTILHKRRAAAPERSRRNHSRKISTRKVLRHKRKNSLNPMACPPRPKESRPRRNVCKAG